MEGPGLLILARRISYALIQKATLTLLGPQGSFYMVNTASRAASTENRDVGLRLQKGWTHSTQEEGLSVLMPWLGYPQKQG